MWLIEGQRYAKRDKTQMMRKKKAATERRMRWMVER